MYRLSQIRRGLRHPMFVGRELNRIFHRRGYRRRFNTSGVQVFDQDWDTLILLDACRYDMFAQRSTLPGTLHRERSAGSSTVEFLEANVDGRDLRDTVYVTANPQLYRHDDIDQTFHHVIHVWKDDGWDQEAKTVLPGTTTEYALEAAKRYPEKRLLVHYIQPHYPFIGSDFDFDFDKRDLHRTDDESPDFWYDLFVRELSVDRSALWAAFERNLDLALEHVSTLLEGVDGKTVVSSDHGNMIGDRASPIPIREWGHPYGVYTDELVEVPWLEVRSGERRTITSEAPSAGSDRVDDDVVEERLQNLGYTA